jgi:hypothetical protein
MAQRQIYVGHAYVTFRHLKGTEIYVGEVEIRS